MKIVVDMELCDAHGQCAFAAPGVFALDEIGDLIYDQNPDDSHRETVTAAMRLCPVAAIRIEA